MTSAVASPAIEGAARDQAAHGQTVVSFWLAGRQFGLPLRDVREVLSTQAATPIPLAPRAVVGSFNLRGRIVTLVDMRRRLGMPPRAGGAGGVTVVVERDQDLFGLAVDAAGDVMALAAEDLERAPAAVDHRTRDCVGAFYRHAGQPLALLDIDRLLNQSHTQKGTKAEHMDDMGVPR